MMAPDRRALVPRNGALILYYFILLIKFRKLLSETGRTFYIRNNKYEYVFIGDILDEKVKPLVYDSLIQENIY